MSKLINVSNEVYKKLAYVKKDKSFSFVIEDLLENKNNTEDVLACAGKGGIDDKAIMDLKKGWKKWTERYV